MFYKPSTKQKFQTHSDIRLAHQGVSLPANLTDDILSGLGVFELVASAPSMNPLTQVATESDPVQVAGKWTQQWIVESLPAEAVTANLLSARTKSADSVKKLRDSKIQAGGYLAGGKWFHSDTFSRTQQLGLVMMGASMPAGLMWKTMGGSFVEMTPSLAQQIFSAAATQDNAMFAHAQSLISQIETSDNPASIDINTGWPVTFQG